VAETDRTRHVGRDVHTVARDVHTVPADAPIALQNIEGNRSRA